VAEAPKTLIIEIDHYYDKLRFYFNDPNDKRSWLIVKDDKFPWMSRLIKEENRQIVEDRYIHGSDFPELGGVSPRGLFYMLATETMPTLRRLIGEEVQVNEVVIRYYDEVAEPKKAKGIEG